MAVAMTMVPVVLVPTMVVVVAKVVAVVVTAIAGTLVVPTGAIATRLGLVLRHTAAHAGTRSAAQASAYNRAAAPAHRLTNGRACSTADRAADHRAIAA